MLKSVECGEIINSGGAASGELSTRPPNVCTPNWCRGSFPPPRKPGELPLLCPLVELRICAQRDRLSPHCTSPFVLDPGGMETAGNGRNRVWRSSVACLFWE